MKLTYINPKRSNPAQIAYEDGRMVLFSYEYPVAAYLPQEGVYVITEDDVTPTTARHIREWVKERPSRYVPQSEIFEVLEARPSRT